MEHPRDNPTPPALAEALRFAYTAGAPDAGAIDDAVLGVEAGRRRLTIRRLAPWAGLAAAAGLALGVSLSVPWGGTRPPTLAGGTLAADLDGSGRVDILDAFLVARSLAGNAGADGASNPAWDVTGDGAVDGRDVEAIAAEAVSLGGAS